MDNDVLLSCSKICKNFGSTRALIHVDFEIRRGEVCGLIGENGSGKSTLTSIIAGVQPPTSGTMRRSGKEYRPSTMAEAQGRGVAIIVQEAGTLPNVDVASNVFVGNFNKFSHMGIVDKKRMHQEANRILESIGAGDIRADTPCGALNFEDRKIIEIARAMYFKPDILIIDETTTALAQKGRAIIYKLIEQMKRENKAVIFISHDLEELCGVCNTISVLRDGVLVGHLRGDALTESRMKEMMVGREMNGHYYRSDWDGSFDDEVVLSVEHITSTDGRIKDLSLQLHRGEILGIGGLADSGMHEIGKMAFGLERTLTGRVVHPQTGKKIVSPTVSVRQKIGYISKDRDRESIVVYGGIRDNVVAASYRRLQKGFLISRSAERKAAQEQIANLSIKCLRDTQWCNQLSGGNKQKVAYAKWLAADCDIFIMDCPTRGIDIGVKATMYELMYQFKRERKSIMMISEELSELIGMSDRMLVIKDGKINAEIARDPTVSDTQLIRYMI